MNRFVKYALVALGYALASEANARLVLPPLYASPVWIPAGLGFGAVMLGGYRMVPALLVGGALSMLGRASLAMGPLSEGGVGTDAAQAAAGVALAALAVASHPALARLLITRLVHGEHLDTLRTSLAYLLLAGPVSCLPSAALGMASLNTLGLIGPGERTGAMLTWWIGDSAGVLVCVAGLLVIDPRTRPAWRNRFGTLAASTAVVLASLISMHVIVANLEERRLETLFRADVVRDGRSLDRRFLGYADALQRVSAAFYGDLAAPDTRTRFDEVANRELDHLPHGAAIQWIVEVRTDVVRDYRSTWAAPQTVELEQASSDPSTAVDWLPALERARDSGRLARTSVQDLPGRRGRGITLLLPVYRGGTVPFTVADRRERFAGVVSSTFAVDQLFERARGPSPPYHLLAIQGGSNAGAIRRVAQVPVDGNLLVHGSESPAEAARAHRIPFIERDRVRLGQRTLTVVYAPTRRFLADHSLFLATLPLGLVTVLLPLLLGALGLVVSGQAERLRTKVARRTRELELRTEHHRRVVEAVEEAIVEFDEEGVITFTNPAWHRVFGKVDTIDPVGVKLEGYIHEEDRERVARAIAEVVAGRLDGATDVEARMSVPGDDPPTVLLRMRAGSPAADTNQGVATAVDVTQRLRDEQSRDDFVALVSHEFRTPVADLSTAIGAMEQATEELPAPARAVLPAMRSATTRLLHLVEDLLLVAQVEAGTLLLEPVSVDLREVVRARVDAAKPMADTQQVTLGARIPTQELPALVDEVRFGQVIDNLLSNALKFTPPGGEVTASLIAEGEHVVLRVADNGIGIPGEELPHLFDRFWRSGDTGRTASGAGLGLTVCGEVVRALGGTIEVESTPSVGSTFLVRLPLDDIDDLEDIPPDDMPDDPFVEGAGGAPEEMPR